MRRAFLLPALLLSACARGPELPDSVIAVGQTAEPRSLDPHVTTALNDFRILVNLYEGLVRFERGTLEVEPALAESFEVSPDGRLYSFRLREGVRFHDGAPLDAEAVRFNFERMLDPEHPYRHTGPFPLAFFFDKIESVETPDARTVRFRLKEPYAPLLSNLAYPTGLLVSPAAVKRWEADYGRHPSGTGPFRFESWESFLKVTLRRNEDYWGGKTPLEAAVFRPLTDPLTRMSELLAGGLDLMMEAPPDVIASFRKRPDFEVKEEIGPHLWFLILNCKEPPFDDRRARVAVNLAIDKEALVREVLQGTAVPAAGPIPKAFAWAHDPSVEPYPRDLARAKALLAEAGYAGETLKLLAPQDGSGMLAPVEMAAAIQADLAEAGVPVEIETFEWNTYLAKVNAGLEGKGHMAEMAWMTNDPDTLPYLALRREAWPDEGGFNSGYYANPEIDRLLAEAREAVSRGRRAALYKKVQRLAHDDAPWAFVVSWKQNAVARAAVEGFRLEPSFFLRLDGVSKR